MLEVTAHFSPMRLTAYARNEAEMEVSVKNPGEQPLWLEADVKVPSAISLAPDRQLEGGRTRLGIALPGESVGKKVKIYAGPQSYPDEYKIMLTIYAYGADGAIVSREEWKEHLRCERGGQE
ncbi:MAG: hypothetical protein KGH63_00055 [Candidatus Micrarchaeota archaeon]|nr:hypothetical protein [Candidatus Micrarchaeota archaeon]